MDVDVNRPIPSTKIYEVEGIRFCGAAPAQMIADKLSAISTDKVFRRIKDVVDLYYISKAFVFDKAEIEQVLNNSGKTLDSFDGFINRSEDLRHAYDKFRFTGGVDKPPFDDVYNAVKAYIKTVLPDC